MQIGQTEPNRKVWATRRRTSSQFVFCCISQTAFVKCSLHTIARLSQKHKCFRDTLCLWARFVQNAKHFNLEIRF